jgi:ABC-2 type transport system ATP-binding protein
MSDILLQASHLSKSFGKQLAVDDFSIELNRGDIYGLVGPDGAGKTTTMRMLVGAMTPDSGDVKICGIDMNQNADLARENLGYLSQQFSLYEDLTVLENIRFFAEIRGLSSIEWKPRALDILEFVGLSEFLDRLARNLSGGMKQKLGLATALVHKPTLMLLDEPTGGVDPVTRQDFWQLIIRLVSEERIGVLVSTPYMDEVARCTHVSMILNGKVIVEGEPDSIPDRLTGQIIEIHGENLRQIKPTIQSIEFIEDVHSFGDKLHIRVSKGKDKTVIKQIKKISKENHFIIHDVSNIDAQLEDVFISLITNSKDNGSFIK